MKLLLHIFLSLLILQGCLPENQVQRTQINSSNSESSDSTGNTDTTDEFENIFGTSVSWYNAGLNSETLSIDVNNTKTIYLTGDKVNLYLSTAANFSSTYCLETRFNTSLGNIVKRLKVKVLPAYSTTFVAGKKTRFFRVNLSTTSGNNFCDLPTLENVDGTLAQYASNDSNFDGIVNGSDTAFVYGSQDVCTNCQGIIGSKEVILYQHQTNGTTTTIDDYLKRIDLDVIDYNKLSLRIDMNANSGNGQSSCTNTQCQSQGYDCCSNGQCINEKSIKSSGVAADNNGFILAEQEKFTNPNWYKNYPQFYNICLEDVPEDEDDGDNGEPTDPIGESEDRFQELLNDYKCIEELKANTTSDPFHLDPLNSSASYSACNISDTSATLYYKEVMKRIYSNCGCSEKTDLDAMVANCPAYTYTPIYETNSSGVQTTNIISLNCYSPPPIETDLPFQDMEVMVNSKSAPHRFFDTNNIEINPEKALPANATGIQEGNEFTYLDDFYIFPNNGSFNMNSILGQFNVQLSKAYPAKMIDVEFDKQYIISTLSGLYQGCTTCGKDSWFNNFSLFPTANRGVGLQAIGYTTSRNTYSTNLSLGNYEDTIFGRACFVPPTMLPFSHNENSNAQTQRQNRLTTQAAMFVNGYQRDWYGFNRGALIGSFDGVTWFAIGKGRIVKSTSNKLYLAINAPFADLANPTNHQVSVQEYDFSSSGAVYDYDPSLEINDATQNEAGSCQKWHQCNVDSDCITKLGWEYVCSDVTYQQTKWPSFNADDATEIANSSATKTIAEILKQGTLPPGDSSKRCVYRGAGTPCRTDYENISDEGIRKTLACAPNFYCAPLNSNNAFNKEVARFGRPLTELVETKNHYYGMDANLIGRPKHYISKSDLYALPNEAQTSIEKNILKFDSSATGKVGLCRPGKLLPSYSSATGTSNWEQEKQHKTRDPEYRTDYISQISGCNSTLYTDMRFSSCPILDEDGNYINTQNDFLNSNFYIDELDGAFSKKFTTKFYSTAQNSCGLESLAPSTVLTTSTTAEQIKNLSAFKTIEGETLANSAVQYEPTLSRDACFRKPGAVCHTNLDCSPNKLMAEAVDLAPLSYFGNLAEKSYFEEYLICGQAKSEPSTSAGAEYFEYNMHNNRCCREVGKSITMFTENSPNAEESTDIRTDLFGSFHPTNSQRYSRYSSASIDIDTTTKVANIIRPSADAENGGDKILDHSPNITNTYQWKTVHDTAARTCCGSNWVREFSDGTNNWSKNRLNIDPANFKCLNYKSALYLTEEPNAYNVSSQNLDYDRSYMCRDSSGATGGCIQNSIPPIDDFSTIRPRLNTLNTGAVEYKQTFNSNNEKMDDLWSANPWSFDKLKDLFDPNPDANLILDWENADNDIERKNLITRLPSYITFDNINSTLDIAISLTDLTNTNQRINCVNNNAANTNFNCGAGGHGGLCGPTDSWTSGTCSASANNTCCFSYDPSSRSLRVGYSNASRIAANYETENYDMQISWTPVGTLSWERRKALALAVDDQTVIAHRRSSTPGNSMYYLKKLARLEYLGIPQMTYEPLYCNDIYQKVVPGIFKDEAFGEKLQTVVDFINHSKTFIDPNTTPPWQTDSAPIPYNANALNKNLVGTQELVDHQQIFSDNQFKCCRELGSTVASTAEQTMCCSGFAAKEQNGNDIKCMLPPKTDLNVYFNKFISGEGLSTLDEDVETLEVTDFDAQTGEPLTNTSVLRKISNLGKMYCSSGKVRRGGAFGRFNPEPLYPLDSGSGGDSSGNPNSIVDSNYDSSTSNQETQGYTDFVSGYRWNHHYYCAE